MRKLFTLLLIMSLVFTLFGCSKKNNDDGAKETSGTPNTSETSGKSNDKASDNKDSGNFDVHAVATGQTTEDELKTRYSSAIEAFASSSLVEYIYEETSTDKVTEYTLGKVVFPIPKEWTVEQSDKEIFAYGKDPQIPTIKITWIPASDDASLKGNDMQERQEALLSSLQSEFTAEGMLKINNVDLDKYGSNQESSVDYSIYDLENHIIRYLYANKDFFIIDYMSYKSAFLYNEACSYVGQVVINEDVEDYPVNRDYNKDKKVFEGTDYTLYVVGYDIPAGKYRIYQNDTSVKGRYEAGKYVKGEQLKDSERDSLDEENPTIETTLTDGMYIQLEKTSIELIE